MLLAIDIGNTNVVMAIMHREKILVQWRMSTSLTKTRDEFWVSTRLLADNAGILPDKISNAVLSSVVPALTDTLANMCRDYLSLSPLIIDHTLNLDMPILYENPAEVGPDRICNAYGALDDNRDTLIVVDMGTATTFDVVKNRSYLGGVIMPGLETSARDLFRRAARLPKVSFEFPEKILGTRTQDSLQSGLMWGTVDQIDSMIYRISRELNEKQDIYVIATGGLANVIAPKSHCIDRVDNNLTLTGMRLIFNYINSGS